MDMTISATTIPASPKITTVGLTFSVGARAATTTGRSVTNLGARIVILIIIMHTVMSKPNYTTIRDKRIGVTEIFCLKAKRGNGVR